MARETNSDDTIPTSELEIIDQACMAFERECKQIERPSIGKYLEEYQGKAHDAFVRELLKVELYYRKLSQEPPQVKDYVGRLPDYETTIRDVFRDAGFDDERSQAQEPDSWPTPRGVLDATISPPEPKNTAAPQSGDRVHYFGDYELLEEIARGGMGVVYSARQVSLDRPVALKMILSGQLAGDEEVKRFLAEARAAANLDHPNIVPVFEVGQHNEQHYFSMALIDGPSLASRVAEGPLPPSEAVQIVKVVSEAIAYAHHRGVLHRDLKPGNILLANETLSEKIGSSKRVSRKPDHDDQESSEDENANTFVPKLTDFGLAKKLEDDEGLTATGQILGTPAYMPPEQAAGRLTEVTEASDVYSLGAILYCLLTGRPPFQAATAMETVLQVLEEEPVAPRLINPAIPLDLETITLKCLEKPTENRYDSADELAEELGRYQSGEPIHARPVGQAERGWRWCKRNPIVAGLTASLALVLLLGICVSSGLAWYADMNRQVAESANIELSKKTEDLESANGELSEKTEDLKSANVKLSKKTEQLENANIAEKDAKDKSQRSEKETKRTLFRTDMRQVQRYFELSNLREVRRLLQRHIPESLEDEDLRSFVWNYWWNRSHADLKTLRHGTAVETIAISSDGRLLAVGGGDRDDPANHIQLWDLENGEIRATFAVPGDEVVRLAFRNEAKSLVAVTARSWVRRWEINNPKRAAVYQMLPSSPKFYEPLHAAAFMPKMTHAATATHEGQIVLVSLDHEAVLLDPDDEDLLKMLQRLPPSEKKRLGVNKDGADPRELNVMAMKLELFGLDGRVAGKRVRSGDEEPTVTILKDANLRASSLPMMQRLGKGDENSPPPSQYGGPVFSLAISPDSKHLVAGSRNGEISLWSLEEGGMIYSRPAHNGIVWSLTVSSDNRLLASSGDDGIVKVWSLADGNLMKQFDSEIAAAVKYVLFDAKGTRLATADTANNITIWDLGSGEVERVIKGHEAGVECLTFHPTKPFLFSGSTDGTVKVWDLQTSKDEFQISGLRNVNTIYSLPKRNIVMATDEFGKTYSWDLRTGHRMRAISKALDIKPCIAFNSANELFATVARAKNKSAIIQVWNSTEGSLESTIKELNPPPVPLPVFSPSGRLIVVANSPWRDIGEDKKPRTITVWDVETGEALAALKPDQAIEPQVFTASESILITLASDQTLQAWNLETKEEAAIKYVFDATNDLEEDETISCRWAAVSPDDKQLAAAYVTSSGGHETTAEIQIWNLQTGDKQKTIDLGAANIPIASGKYFPLDDRLIFQTVVSNWEAARPLELELEKLEKTIRRAIAVRDRERTAEIQRKMREVASQLRNYREHRISVCEVNSSKVTTVVKSNRSWGSLALLSGGQILAASRWNNGLIEFHDTITGRRLRTLALDQQAVDDLKFAPDGETLFLATQRPRMDSVGLDKFDNLLVSWNPETDQREAVILGQHWMGSKTLVAISPDGETLAGQIPTDLGGIFTIGGGHMTPFSGKLLLIPLNTNGKKYNQTRPIRSHTHPATGFAFLPLDEGHMLASSSVDGTIRLSIVRRIETPTTIEYKAKESGVLKKDGVKFFFDVAFAPNGKILAAAADNTIQLWDFAEQKLVRTIEGHQEYVRSIAFAPDGNRIVSGSSDGTIKIWDIAGDDAPLTIVGHSGGVSSVAISPDGKTIASGGRDRSVRLWDLKSGEEKAAFHVHTLPITSVTFSMDGTQLAASGEDGYVKLWRTRSAPLMSKKER